MNIEKKLHSYKLIFIGSCFMLIISLVGLFASSVVKTTRPSQNPPRIKAEVVVKKPQYKQMDDTFKKFKLQQKLLIF